MVDAGGVDDARRRVEALAVEARGGLVQSLVVERGGERALLEVAADDRHRVDRGGGRHAQAAERRDQAAAGRVGQRQVVDRGGEDVGDLLRDQLLGRGHADVERLRVAADRRARLLAERRVGLVADHELVGVARDRVGVAGEPGVGLDRDRVLARRGLAALDRVHEALAVALGGQVALELGDEQAAVGEDEDAERSCRLDEARCGDRLAGRRRVAEAVAPHRAGILAGELRLVVGVGLLVGRLELVLLVGVLGLELRLGVAVAVAVQVLGLALVRRDQLGQHPGERVDLVLAQLGAGGGRGRLRREHALEAEQEAEPDLPARRRRAAAALDLDERLVERGATGRSGRKGFRRILAGMEEGLAGPFLRAERVGGQAVRRVRRECRIQYRF